MERVNGILKDPLYRTCLSKIALFERDRIFCGHDMAHFLDVARLAYIFNLEENLGIEKEEIYTAALLHDVGRFVQYEDGTPHQLAGLPFAKELMERYRLTKKKRKRAFYGPLRITGTERSGRKKVSRESFTGRIKCPGAALAVRRRRNVTGARRRKICALNTE